MPASWKVTPASQANRNVTPVMPGWLKYQPFQPSKPSQLESQPNQASRLKYQLTGMPAGRNADQAKRSYAETTSKLRDATMSLCS